MICGDFYILQDRYLMKLPITIYNEWITSGNFLFNLFLGQSTTKAYSIDVMTFQPWSLFKTRSLTFRWKLFAIEKGFQNAQSRSAIAKWPLSSRSGNQYLIPRERLAEPFWIDRLSQCETSKLGRLIKTISIIAMSIIGRSWCRKQSLESRLK